MVGATYRVDAWNAKVKATRLLTDLTALLPDMTIRMNARTIALVAMETAVKQECDNAGVPTIQYPGYLAFGREIHRKSAIQEISGPSLAMWTAMMQVKWVARGLTAGILGAIKTNVFSVSNPIAP